jgi:hypothetical protein
MSDNGFLCLARKRPRTGGGDRSSHRPRNDIVYSPGRPARSRLWLPGPPLEGGLKTKQSRSLAPEAGQFRRKAYGITRSPADREATAARRRWIMPMPRRAIDNDTSDDSGTPSGPSFASDWALTAKSTGPTPGNVTEKPGGVRSCGVPFIAGVGVCRNS